MNAQEKYLEEYGKYKNVPIETGHYSLKSNSLIKVEILSINLEKETVQVKTIKSGFVKEKTLHWCRKNLIREV